jgi:hypothetical protein
MPSALGSHDQWNASRALTPSSRPDFRQQVFLDSDFRGYNLADADFREAILRGCSFEGANLTGAVFTGADAAGASFKEAQLANADFSGADLSRASFYGAALLGTNFTGANLFRVAFRAARCRGAIFADVDLETAVGLADVRHVGPSSLSIDTLFRSSGNIPKSFLLGVGLPDMLVEYVPSLVEADAGIHFHSCFISYTHADEAFARRLWARMREEGIRVWFAPEEMRGGAKLFDQIERAIHMHDKLVLVLSDHSMKSNWVKTEIRRACQQESLDGIRKLFPLRLNDMTSLRKWSCPDADSGNDLAVEIREYYIPDFSQWAIESSFEKEFKKLRRDLRAEGVAMDARPKWAKRKSSGE